MFTGKTFVVHKHWLIALASVSIYKRCVGITIAAWKIFCSYVKYAYITLQEVVMHIRILK